MFTTGELKALLAGVPRDVLAKVYVALGSGRHLEAVRLMAAHLGDGPKAQEVVGSLVRREVRRNAATS